MTTGSADREGHGTCLTGPQRFRISRDIRCDGIRAFTGTEYKFDGDDGLSIGGYRHRITAIQTDGRTRGIILRSIVRVSPLVESKGDTVNGHSLQRLTVFIALCGEINLNRGNIRSVSLGLGDGDLQLVVVGVDAGVRGFNEQGIFLGVRLVGVGREIDRDNTFSGARHGIYRSDSVARNDRPVHVAGHIHLHGRDVGGNTEFILRNPEELHVRRDENDIVLRPYTELRVVVIAGIARDVILARFDRQAVLLVTESKGGVPVGHRRIPACERSGNVDTRHLHSDA